MNSANKRAHNQQEEKQGESWRTQDIICNRIEAMNNKIS